MYVNYLYIYRRFVGFDVINDTDVICIVNDYTL